MRKCNTPLFPFRSVQTLYQASDGAKLCNIEKSICNNVQNGSIISLNKYMRKQVHNTVLMQEILI